MWCNEQGADSLCGGAAGVSAAQCRKVEPVSPAPNAIAPPPSFSLPSQSVGLSPGSFGSLFQLDLAPPDDTFGEIFISNEFMNNDCDAGDVRYMCQGIKSLKKQVSRNVYFYVIDTETLFSASSSIWSRLSDSAEYRVGGSCGNRTDIQPHHVRPSTNVSAVCKRSHWHSIGSLRTNLQRCPMPRVTTKRVLLKWKHHIDTRILSLFMH